MYLGDATPKPDFRTTLGNLPDGEAGVRATLNIMKAIKNQYKKLPTIRNQAISIIQNAPQKSFMQEIKSLHAFVRDSIRYTRDIAGVETVQTPDVTLYLRAGDCDDKSVLLATMLESVGHISRYFAMGTRPGRLTHVFVETKFDNKWVALDPTEPFPAGWRPPGIVERMIVGP